MNDQFHAARLRIPSPANPDCCLSRRELAALVDQWVLDHRDRRRGIDEVYVGKVERGEVRWPNADYRAAFRAVLDAESDTALGFHPRRGRRLTGGDPKWNEPPTSAAFGRELDAPPEPWQLMDALTRSSIDPRAVSSMDRTVCWCAEVYPTESTATLKPVVHRLIQRVTAALDQPLPIAIRRELVRLLGYAAGLAANIANDDDQVALAHEFFRVAAFASQEGTDKDLAAWVLTNRAIACYSAGEVAPARSLLEIAAQCARQDSGPRRRAWVSAHRARSLAANNQSRQAVSLLDEAESILAETSDPTGGTDFFDPTRLEGLRGSSLLWLGQLDEAEAVLARAIQRRPTSEVKGKALLMLDLAQCRLMQNEQEEAVRLMATSVELATGSLVKPIVSKTLRLVNVAREGPASALVADDLHCIEAKVREEPS